MDAFVPCLRLGKRTTIMGLAEDMTLPVRHKDRLLKQRWQTCVIALACLGKKKHV